MIFVKNGIVRALIVSVRFYFYFVVTLVFFIAVSFMLCHQVLGQEQPNKLWLAALESNWVIPLFRDEVLYVHSYVQAFFEGMKGYGKRISEVKDCYSHAVQKA